MQNLRTSQIIDPPDGRIPPVTEEARQRAAAQAAERKQRGGGQYDQVQNMPQRLALHHHGRRRSADA